MHNVKLTIAYEGTQYAGWQRQNRLTSHVTRLTLKTIQETIEAALQKIFQKKITLIGSGRTDAGVHAIAQIANFKTERFIPLEKIKKALNGLLPRDIAIRRVEEVALDFHSRFCVLHKTYRYLIVHDDSKITFLRPFTLWIRSPLDVSLMRREARCLIGRHDFKSFQATERRKRNSVATIHKIKIRTWKIEGCVPFLKDLDFIAIDITASGFLRNMVRNIIGTLLEVGMGKKERGELKKILKIKDRRLAGPCAPPCGLYLMDVVYAQC